MQLETFQNRHEAILASLSLQQLWESQFMHDMTPARRFLVCLGWERMH